MRLRPVRVAVAIAAVVLLIAAAVAPHAHEGPLGSHACVACVAANAEEATPQTPDLAPRQVVTADVCPRPLSAPAYGLPLGAIPGQSPPSV